MSMCRVWSISLVFFYFLFLKRNLTFNVNVKIDKNKLQNVITTEIDPYFQVLFIAKYYNTYNSIQTELIQVHK